MPFRRYVEIGRVAMINYGDEYGQLVVIVDVVDHNRALVDHPNAKRRWVVNFRRLVLTDFKIEIPRLVSKENLKKAVAEDDVFKKFEQTAWGRRIARRKEKAEMTDFDRYKVMVARRKRAVAVRAAYRKLCKDAEA